MAQYDSAMTQPAVDIRALAQLSRLEVSDAELEKLEKEIPDILAFVETIQGAGGDLDAMPSAEHRNVMRDDVVVHEAGAHTETLISAAPQRSGDRIAVKQVVSRTRS